MTLANTPIVNSYVGTGGANNYAFNFPVFQAGDIAVTATSPSGTLFNLLLTTDYTVSNLNPTGAPPTTGSITLVNSGQAWLTGGNLTTGWSISITRLVSIAQNTSIRNQGDFYQETIESTLDYLTMICQQLQQAINSPILPKSLTSVTGDITITSNGNGLVVSTPNGLHTYRITVDNNGNVGTQQIT